MRKGSEGRAERQHKAGDGEYFAHGDCVTAAGDESIGGPPSEDGNRARSGKRHEREPTRSSQGKAETLFEVRWHPGHAEVDKVHVAKGRQAGAPDDWCTQNSTPRELSDSLVLGCDCRGS